MELKIYPKLSTRSKRAFLRTKKKWGHSYRYYPNATLVERLKRELGLTHTEILDQIRKEQQFLKHDHEN